jgi:glucuronokinase
LKYARGVARVRVPARSALVGNPSDGFGGATIAFTLDELEAVVRAEPALGVELEAEGERLEFADLGALGAAAARGEYPSEGPLALMMAASRRFAERNEGLADRGVRLRVERSTIPPAVGLAGSSAIVIGALRALGDLFGDPIPVDQLPEFALACEAEELGIPAGLQDRVVQTYGGLIFMDFDPSLPGWGRHEPLDDGLLPSLFVAWLAGDQTDSGEIHRSAHERFDRGDDQIAAVMSAIGGLARRALTPLTLGDGAGLGVLLDENFDLRRRIYDLDPRHVAMIAAARELGAPANYTGSGGAIVGLFRDEDHLARLRESLEALGCELLVRRSG